MKDEVLPTGKGDRYYGKTAQNYELRRKKQPWWSVEQIEMESLLAGLPKGLSVVDVPFGTGRFVPYYNKLGYKVAGLDASKEMLEAAEAALGAEFKDCKVTTGFSTALPYKDGEFDLLVSTRFLRDIIPFGDAKTSLAEFARVTKKYAIIQLGHTIEGGETPGDGVTMRSVMSAKDVEKLLNDHGFKLIEKRLVKSDPDDNSEIHHMLCEKIAK